jgi:ribosomal protein S17E
MIIHTNKRVVSEYSDEATKALLNIVKTVKESTAEALKKIQKP